MKKSFEETKRFHEKWIYQQEVYLEKIWKNLVLFLIHFPLGFINFIFHFLLIIISFPIVLGKTFECRSNSFLLRDPKLDQVPGMKDKFSRDLVIKVQKKAIEEHEALFKQSITFLLGVITTLITIYMTKLIGINK